MKLSKRALMMGGGSAAVCALIAGATSVSAAGTGKPASLASEISSAFHLNQSDVQKVIDQHKGEVQSYRQEKNQDRLDQAVKDGKITSAQETLILNEDKQIQSDLQGIQGQTGSDRRTAMQQERAKVQQWAKDNNIPLRYVMPMHRGFTPLAHPSADGGVSPSPAPQT